MIMRYSTLASLYEVLREGKEEPCFFYMIPHLHGRYPKEEVERNIHSYS